MKIPRSNSKARSNYYIDIIAFVPFLLLLITGIIMLAYHAGKPYTETILNKDGEFWLNTHIIFAVISFVMTIIHLSLHINWFKKLFTEKLKNKYWVRNLILLILFLFTTLTSVFPWLILEETDIAKLMLGLHNKIGLLLIVFFLVHILSYYGWLLKMTKKILGSKQVDDDK